ncbi:hypothetical protein ABK040_009128 [Willaertia magna]
MKSIIFSLLLLTFILVISVLSAEEEDDNDLKISPYKDYHVDIELLTTEESGCTTYVFPGVSLCNFKYTQTIFVDMPPMKHSDKEGADGVNTFITPKIPVTGVTYKYSKSVHLNYHESNETEAIQTSDPGYEEIITYDNTKNPPEMLTQLKFNYYKNYTNPQVFSITMLIEGRIKTINNGSLYQSNNVDKINYEVDEDINVNATDINTIDWYFVSNYTAYEYLQESGYSAIIHFPWKELKRKHINIYPSDYTTYHLNGTMVYHFQQSGDDIAEGKLLGNVHARFVAKYPPCEVMLTPTIAMWVITSSVSALTLLVVIIRGAFKVVETKSRRSGYNPQVD